TGAAEIRSFPLEHLDQRFRLFQAGVTAEPEQRIHHVHGTADRDEDLRLRIEPAYFFRCRSRIQIPWRTFAGMLSAITVENVEILVQAAEIAGKLQILRKKMQLLFPRDEYFGMLPQIVAERDRKSVV